MDWQTVFYEDHLWRQPQCSAGHADTTPWLARGITQGPVLSRARRNPTLTKATRCSSPSSPHVCRRWVIKRNGSPCRGCWHILQSGILSSLKLQPRPKHSVPTSVWMATKCCPITLTNILVINTHRKQGHFEAYQAVISWRERSPTNTQ